MTYSWASHQVDLPDGRYVVAFPIMYGGRVGVGTQDEFFDDLW